MALTRHVNVADAIDAQDVPAFHQIADAILPVSSAQFLVLAASAPLANERVFTPGTALSAVDGGAGGAYTLNVVPSALGLDATFITQTPSGVLANEQAMSLSATGVVMNTTATGVLSTVAFTAGAIPFGTTGGGHLTQNASRLTWDNVANILSVIQGSGEGIRVGTSATDSYLIGRNSSAGPLEFYGGQTGFVGYRFGGIDGDRLVISTTGTVTIANLGGGTSALARASTVGLLSRTTVATADIDNDAVTYAKIQNVSADRLLGRGNGGGSGDVQEIALGTHLSFSTTTLNVGGFTQGSVIFAASDGRLTEENPGLTYDATNNILEIVQATSQGLRLGAGTSGTSYLIGRHAGTGTLEFYGGQTGATAYRFGGIDGDWMVIGTTGTVTIGDLGGAAATLVKTSTTGLLSRASATTDYTAIITLTAGNGMTGGGTTAANRTFDVVAADATIVVNADSIQAGVMQTANYAAGSVTFAKIEALTASHLLGRGSASAGSPESIIIGTGLTMTSTTLSVTGMAPDNAQYLTLATHASLSAERVLLMSTGFTTSDGGANGNYTVTNNVFVGEAGSPTWQGSNNANNLTIKANTASTGTLSLTATQIAVSGYQTINQGSPLSTAYLDADVIGSRENVRFKVAGTTISDNGSRSYFQVFPRSGVTVGSGVTDASQIWTTMYLESTTFTAASGSPVTFAATTLYIQNAPVAAGGLIITNPFAMWVDDGRSRFDGDSSGYVFELPSLSTLPAGTVNEPDRYLQVWITGLGRRFISMFSVT